MTTIIGVSIMVIMIGMAMGTIGPFLDLPSAQIVIFSTIAGGFASFPLSTILRLPSIVSKVVSNDKTDPIATIKLLVEFSEKARREGILSLDSSTDKIADQFLKTGIQLAVDGMEPEPIRDILKTNISAIEARHEDNLKIFEYMGALAPAMGMIGTFVGLVLMLGQMSDISTLGPNMAIAVLTSLYGAIIANCICGPITNILTEKSKAEILIKNIMVEGIMSIQAGDNPRIVEQKLASCLDPVSRVKVVRQR